MASMMRQDSRTRRNGIVRRLVNLPRNLLGEFSRAMGHGFNDLMSIGGARRQQIFPPPLQPPQEPSLFPPSLQFQRDQNYDIWEFLSKYEEQYGHTHPFFYACRFRDAMKMAEEDQKLVFVYLHAPDHPFTEPFCRGTLGCEPVVQYLDSNFVSWGALAHRGEGAQLAGALRASCFPFCAVIAPANSDSVAVLQQIEGPVSPAEMVEILMRTMEEQGAAFSAPSGRPSHEESIKRLADRRLREEQDAAYLAALKIDQEKETLKTLPSEKTDHKQPAAAATAAPPTTRSSQAFHEWPRHSSTMIKPSKVKEPTSTSQNHPKDKDPQRTQIMIRFPNGERRQQSFNATDKIQAVYKYIDSLGLHGVGSYRLISSFPRKIHGIDQMGLSLKDAGLHPRSTLFLDLL